MDQARIYRFLEKTKKNRKKSNDKPDGDSDPATEECITEQDKLRKKVAMLMKKQKMQKAIQIVKKHDDIKPWGQEGHVKVCCAPMSIPMNMEAIF